MTRMSAERLRELEAIRRDNREACHWGHVGDLLEELAAVTRERDEARESLGLAEKYGRTKQDVDLINEIGRNLIATQKERDQARVHLTAMQVSIDALAAERDSWKQQSERERDLRIEAVKREMVHRAENARLTKLLEKGTK